MVEKSILEKMYREDQLSMMEIAGRLHMTHHGVRYWMQKYEISARSRSDATYVKRNPDGDPFKIKTDLTPAEMALMGVGLGLFWGEGNKANDTAVRLGNTDPALLCTFNRFLREICGVEEKKIRFWLQIFSDINEAEALDYWMYKLGVTRDRFTPHVIVSPPQGKGTYRNRSKYGVVTVFVCNKKLRDWLTEQLVMYEYKPT